MKIHIAKYEPNRIGGGWSFCRNLFKGLEQVYDYNEADIYFIPSPSMVQRDEVLQAKKDGKKVVLRIDNAVRNSRNRNTGMTRMKDFAEWADLIVYQSEWARDYLREYLGKDGIVIHNGVDIELYQPREKTPGTVLYSRFNRDETKNYEVARYWYSRYSHKNPESKLYIVGQFSDELRDGNFDFYNNESFEYLGVLDERNMAKLYSVTEMFLYTYFNDACSNSLIEALVSGCKIVGDKYYRNTGGATEIREAFRQNGREYFSIERMVGEYVEQLSKLT